MFGRQDGDERVHSGREKSGRRLKMNDAYVRNKVPLACCTGYSNNE